MVVEDATEGDVLTIDEAATMLGVSKMTLYRRIKSREIEPIRDNPALKRQLGGVKFKREDVERLKRA